jgi:hypothetical protein
MGMKMSDWAQAWFEWLTSIPQSSSPDMALDLTGARGSVGQHGPVWFTPGNSADSNATRSYTIPAGKAILLCLGGGFVKTIPGDRTDDQLLTDQEAASQGGEAIREVSVDGVPIPDVSQYYIATPVFSIVLPPGNLFGISVPKGKDPRLVAAGSGYWMLFPPPSVGKHLFVSRAQGTYPSGEAFKWELTLSVTVQQANKPLE